MSVAASVIIHAMEQLAPRYLAESWDNIGLLVGHPDQQVDRVLVALDVTVEVAEAAAQQGCQLIICHHPPLFKPLKAIRTDGPQGAMLSLLLRNDIAVYAAHTNLDIAPGGVNDALAVRLGLRHTQPLQVTYEEKLLKLAVFVPQTHLVQVREALCQAGAGHIGNYSHCTFQAQGQGTFLPLAGTTPFLGQQGQMEYAAEARLETVLSQEKTEPVLRALREAHPYEEIAYDLYPLSNTGKHYGLGRVGKLSAAIPCSSWLEQLKKALLLSHVTVAGNTEKSVQTIAVCGGSGAGLIDQAARLGADVFVTGDVKYHEAQQALALGLTIVDAGHFATEQPVVESVAAYLRNRAWDANWQVDFNCDLLSQDVFKQR